jgi:hypothetical protein
MQVVIELIRELVDIARKVDEPTKGKEGKGEN